MQQTLHHLQPILCQRFPARCINHGDGNIIHRQCGLLLQVGQRLPCPEQIRGGKISQRPGTVFAPGIGHGGQTAARALAAVVSLIWLCRSAINSTASVALTACTASLP